MRNLRVIAFRHLIKYDTFYVLIGAVIAILFAIFITQNSQDLAENSLIVKNFADNLFADISICCVFLFYCVVLALLKERVLNIAEFLKSTNEYFEEQDIDEIYSSIKELDTRDFISLEKKYLAYKKEQKEMEISKIKAKLKAEREKALQKEQRIFDMKKEIEESITWDDMLLDAKNKNISTMPFDIYAYVSTFDDIEIINDDLGCEVSGIIEYINNGFVIAINKYHSYERRRFTLAHEFAHYAMHKEYIIKNKKIEDVALFRDRKSEIENEANEFASKLLMPKDEFIEAIKSGKKRLGDLAEHFGVTAMAVKYRAYKLDLIA